MMDAMTDLPETVISRAVRADAEAARAEIRAAGIVCPSCGVNAADLPRDHMLALDMGGIDWVRAEKRPATAKCQSGVLVTLSGDSPMDDASYETWKAAANVNLLDTFRKGEEQAFREQVIGTGGGAKITGFLEMLP